MAASTVVVILVAGLLLIVGVMLAARGGEGDPRPDGVRRVRCQCDELNPANAKYCRRCGRELRTGDG